MPHPGYQVLLIGDPIAAEMAPVMEVVRAAVAPRDLRLAPEVAAVRRLPQGPWFPELIVLLQTWPDQFSAQDLRDLLTLYPLARLVCCFGPWCDSDGRTRTILPLAIRISASTAGDRIACELDLLRQPVAAPLPLTASRNEIFDCDYVHDMPHVDRSPRTLVISPDRAWKTMLEMALCHAGFQPHLETDRRSPDSLLFDADPWDETRADNLRRLHARYPDTSTIALLGFPRPDLTDALMRAGADRVEAKLLPLAKLIEIIDAA